MKYYLNADWNEPGSYESSGFLHIPLYETLSAPDGRQLKDITEPSTALTSLHNRSFYSNWHVVDEDGTRYDEFSLFINEKKESSLREPIQPFLLIFGFVQFRVEPWQHASLPPVLQSKYCSNINPTDGENIRQMIHQILQIRTREIHHLLEWPSCTPSEDTYTNGESPRYSMLTGLMTPTSAGQSPSGHETVWKALETYRRHGGYFLTRPEFTVRKQQTPVQYHQVRQLTRDSMLWSVKNGAMRPIPSQYDQGIQIHGQSYFPSKTLSEIAQRDYRIYENKIIVGFLDTLYRSVEDQALLNNSEQEDAFRLIRMILLPGENGSAEPEMTPGELLEQLSILRSQYLQYLRLEKRDIPTVTCLPMQTKRFLEVQPYRDIYHCMANWFQDHSAFTFGEGSVFRGRLADTVYEYFCWLQLLQVFHTNGWKKSRPCERTNYDGKRPLPPFSNIVHLEHEDWDARVTLYFDPWIPSWKSLHGSRHGITLRRLSLDPNVPDGKLGYTPDFVIKTEQDGTVSYAILDAKFRPMDQLFHEGKPIGVPLCTMEQVLYKYYMDLTDLSGPQRPIKMVWLLQGLSHTGAAANERCSIVSSGSPRCTLGFLDQNYLRDLSWGAASLNSYNFRDWRSRFWSIFQHEMLD